MELGVVSSAAQIEGGELRHNWKDWYECGYIKDGSNPARGCNHWQRWKEDIDLLKTMGIKHYRFSIEWARLEPENGYYDGVATAQYREMIMYMKTSGITPLMTLHHFTHPLWFEDIGGFANPDNIQIFLKYVAFAVRTFGDLVNEYITINEPNFFAIQGYFTAKFPPGKKNITTTTRVMSVMASCHVRAYQLIHRMRHEMGYNNTKVGFAHHMQVFTPTNSKNMWQVNCARALAWSFQGIIEKACLKGKFSLPLKKYGNIKKGEYCDFLGITYYGRSFVTGFKYSNPSSKTEIYPRGVIACAKKLHAILPRPIYITANGTCENSEKAVRFIYDHLRILEKCNLFISRYYYWSFTDSFEWCEGESARFGLVHVDYDTQIRIIKGSGHFYSEAAKKGQISKELLAKHIETETR